MGKKIGHYTLTGRVVYDRPTHVIESRDVMRMLIHIQNNNKGDAIFWHAVFKIASHHAWSWIDPTPPADIDKATGFSEFLKKFDVFVQEANFFLSGVPVAGEILALVSYLYLWVRRNFPV